MFQTKNMIVAAIIAGAISCTLHVLTRPGKPEPEETPGKPIISHAFTLPDGREVEKATVNNGFFGGVHHIYFVANPDNGGSTVTTNYKTGKASRTEVFIDGVKYQKAPEPEKTPEENPEGSGR